MVSGERGEHVTANICFSAAGKYMDPTVIFPRKNYNADFEIGKPEGTAVEFNPSGYMNTEIFSRWMQRFIEVSEPSDKKKSIIEL